MQPKLQHLPEESTMPSSIKLISQRGLKPTPKCLMRKIAELVEAVTRNKAVGYVALFVALASLFVWPVLLGISGIVLGVIAFLMGNKRLGSWSIALGFIAVAAYFLLVPYYA